MIFRFAFPALMAALPVMGLAQEPWHGDWAAEAEWCAKADQIGSVTLAPIRLTRDEYLGYENSCAISEVLEVGVNAWRLSTVCQSEGSVYEEEMLVMVDAATLWMWVGGGAPIPFHRCGG